MNPAYPTQLGSLKKYESYSEPFLFNEKRQEERVQHFDFMWKAFRLISKMNCQNASTRMHTEIVQLRHLEMAIIS